MTDSGVLTSGDTLGLNTVAASDIQTPERALWYGPPGVGKTPILGSGNLVAAFHPMLFIDVDGGSKSLKVVDPSIRVHQVRTFKKLYQAFERLHDAKGGGYNCIVVDGVPTAQAIGVEHLYYDNKGGRNYNFVDFETATLTNGGFTASTQQMRILTEAFKQLPCHIFFTAWARNIAPMPKRIGESVPPMWVPDFPDKTRNAITGGFESILYLSVYGNDNVVKLQARSGTTVMARDRGNRLPPTMELWHPKWDTRKLGAQPPAMQLVAKEWGLDATLIGK